MRLQLCVSTDKDSKRNVQSRKIYLEQMREIEINWTALKYFEIRFRLNFYRCYIKALFLEKRPGNRLCLCVMLKFSKNFHNFLTCINNFQINVATDEVSGGNLQFWIKYLEWKKKNSKLESTRKLWYLLLSNFWLLLTRFLSWKRYWGLGVIFIQ